MIYFYLKYKTKLFFIYIKNREYILIKNVETEGSSKLGYKISSRKANIIFLDEEIFILSLNNSIIQLTKSNEVFPNVFYKYTYDSKLKVNDILEIKNTNIKVRLNLKNKNLDLHSIDNHL